MADGRQSVLVDIGYSIAPDDSVFIPHTTDKPELSP